MCPPEVEDVKGDLEVLNWNLQLASSQYPRK